MLLGRGDVQALQDISDPGNGEYQQLGYAA